MGNRGNAALCSAAWESLGKKGLCSVFLFFFPLGRKGACSVPATLFLPEPSFLGFLSVSLTDDGIPQILLLEFADTRQQLLLSNSCNATEKLLCHSTAMLRKGWSKF